IAAISVPFSRRLGAAGLLTPRSMLRCAFPARPASGLSSGSLQRHSLVTVARTVPDSHRLPLTAPPNLAVSGSLGLPDPQTPHFTRPIGVRVVGLGRVVRGGGSSGRTLTQISALR